MKAIRGHIFYPIVVLLLALNISVINSANAEAESEITKNEFMAQCFLGDWTQVDMGTGFGCGNEYTWCSDIFDYSSCTIYRFFGEPLIVIEG